MTANPDRTILRLQRETIDGLRVLVNRMLTDISVYRGTSIEETRNYYLGSE